MAEVPALDGAPIAIDAELADIGRMIANRLSALRLIARYRHQHQDVVVNIQLPRRRMRVDRLVRCAPDGVVRPSNSFAVVHGAGVNPGKSLARFHPPLRAEEA
jgi:hypothetical protein